MNLREGKEYNFDRIRSFSPIAKSIIDAKSTTYWNSSAHKTRVSSGSDGHVIVEATFFGSLMAESEGINTKFLFEREMNHWHFVGLKIVYSVNDEYRRLLKNIRKRIAKSKEESDLKNEIELSIYRLIDHRFRLGSPFDYQKVKSERFPFSKIND
jgi:hypothetical protein